MTAAILEALDGLPKIACMAPVPFPRATEVHRPTGTRQVRRCVLPNGHGQFEVACRYEWFEEHVTVADIDQEIEF